MRKSTHSSARKNVFRSAALLLGAVLVVHAIILIGTPDANRSQDIYSSVLRLHIRANSDSDRDQSIKLSVRDALLTLTSELFADCKDLGDAKDVALREHELILSNITSTLGAEGADYSAAVSLGVEHFPERVYDGKVFPEGEYTALVVELGEGEGQNWWCVLFPSLCLSASSAKTDDAIEVGLTPGQYEAITEPSTGKYKIKFRFLELLFEFFDR